MTQVTEKLDRVATHFGGGGKATADIAAQLLAIEDDITALDRAMPTSEYRKQLLARKVAEELLCSYARMLTWDSFDDGDRRDRFELVVSRAVLKQGEPPFTMPSREEAKRVLDQIVPTASTVPAAAREDAVAELEKARQNLQSFKNLDELLDQGHYLDVRGYKISLRDRLLDEDILYAVVHWNGSFLDRIRDLTFAQSRPEYEVDSLLRRQADEIDEIFSVSSVDKETAKARMHAVKETVRMSMPEVQRENTKRVAVQSRETRRMFTMAFGVLGLIFAIGLIAVYAMRERNDVVELKLPQLAAISSVLSKGAISNGTGAPVFSGEVNDEWAVMGDTEKTNVAAHIRDALGARPVPVRDALITDGTKQVIQISNGRVRMVESAGAVDNSVNERGRSGF
jgi:hypothetical protein